MSFCAEPDEDAFFVSLKNSCVLHTRREPKPAQQHSFFEFCRSLCRGLARSRIRSHSFRASSSSTSKRYGADISAQLVLSSEPCAESRLSDQVRSPLARAAHEG